MFERNEPKEVELTLELAALEQQLAGLAVAPLQANRDQLMFEAGRAAGRAECSLAATQRVAGAPRWFWPSAAAMLTAACVVLAAMLVWQQDTPLVAQQQAKPQAASVRAAEIGAIEGQRIATLSDISHWPLRPAGGYLQKRYLALTRGVGDMQTENDGDVLSSPNDSAQPATARELMRELVPARGSRFPNS